MAQLFLENVTFQIETIPNGFSKDHFAGSLTKNELVRYGQIKDQLRKDQYLFCRNILKKELSQKLKIAVEKIEIKLSSEGKPLPIKSWHISLSHSENFCGFALAKKNIGFDIQKEKPLKNIEGLIKKICHKNEISLFSKKIAESKKEDLFFRLWTLKEAYAKHLGLGLESHFCDQDFSNVVLSPDHLLIDEKLSYLSCKKADLYYSFCVDSDSQHTLT